MDSPYHAQILDHYRNPRRRGTLEHPDLSAELDNPVCGDVVRLDLRVEGGEVSEARFSGRGCVISMAAASMLTERIVGQRIEALRRLGQEEMFEMLNVTLGPVRAKCAMLPLRVLQEALTEAGP